MPTYDDTDPSYDPTPPYTLSFIHNPETSSGRTKDGYEILHRILKSFVDDTTLHVMLRLIKHLQENDITPFHKAFNFSAKHIHILYGSCKFHDSETASRAVQLVTRSEGFKTFERAVLLAASYEELQFGSYKAITDQSRGITAIEEANKRAMVVSF